MYQSVGLGTSKSVDGAQKTIASVQQLVPFKAWRLGQVQGKTLAWFRFGPDGDEKAEIQRFFACYRSQQRRLDPRAIATVHDPAYPYAVMMSLTAADGAEPMLIALRDKEMGPFTESDFRLLALAKTLSEETLAGTAHSEDEPRPAEPFQRAKPMLFILDQSYQTVMGNRFDALPSNDASNANSTLGIRLPQVFEKTIRDLTAAWAKDPSVSVNVSAMPVPSLYLRIHDLASEQGYFLAVTIEMTRRRNVLLGASKRFFITPREREVVASLLDGMRTDEIAERLSITVSTVNDHIKKLIERTGASNRSQMLARILGWQSRSTKHRND
jgi:DNA-binding CsgD family transcriptional regulator